MHGGPTKVHRSREPVLGALTRLAALVTAVAGWSALAVDYYDIHPGQKVIISFHFNGSTVVSNVTPDLLSLYPGGSLGWHETATTYTLYDGNNLLGSTTRTGDQSFIGLSFRSYNNPLAFDNLGPTTPVDFSTILSGTIHGQLA